MRPLGIFSRAHLESEELFSHYQAQALLYIKQQFGLEDDSFKIEGATWDEFFKARERAEKEGTLDDFDRSVSEQIMPIINQILAQEQ